MGITVIGVTKANLMDIINDPDVYLIKEGWTHKGYRMVPIAEADVGDLLSEKCIIVKITN
jgi:hypothetical protein